MIMPESVGKPGAGRSMGSRIGLGNEAAEAFRSRVGEFRGRNRRFRWRRNRVPQRNAPIFTLINAPAELTSCKSITRSAASQRTI